MCHYFKILLEVDVYLNQVIVNLNLNIYIKEIGVIGKFWYIAAIFWTKTWTGVAWGDFEQFLRIRDRIKFYIDW